MSTKYLLPCTCGTPIAVTPQQAGQTVTCSCGTTREVPKLRELRALEVQSDPMARQATVNWSPTRGAGFAMGILILVLGLSVAAYLHSLVLSFEVPTAESQQDLLQKQVEGANVGDLWKLWTKLRVIALQDRPASARAEAEILERRFTLARNVSLGVSLAGLALSLVAYSDIGRLLGSPGTSRT